MESEDADDKHQNHFDIIGTIFSERKSPEKSTENGKYGFDLATGPKYFVFYPKKSTLCIK